MQAQGVRLRVVPMLCLFAACADQGASPEVLAVFPDASQCRSIRKRTRTDYINPNGTTIPGAWIDHPEAEVELRSAEDLPAGVVRTTQGEVDLVHLLQVGDTAMAIQLAERDGEEVVQKWGSGVRDEAGRVVEATASWESGPSKAAGSQRGVTTYEGDVLVSDVVTQVGPPDIVLSSVVASYDPASRVRRRTETTADGVEKTVVLTYGDDPWPQTAEYTWSSRGAIYARSSYAYEVTGLTLSARPTRFEPAAPMDLAETRTYADASALETAQDPFKPTEWEWNESIHSISVTDWSAEFREVEETTRGPWLRCDGDVVPEIPDDLIPAPP
jgi:hypothetical protein